MRVIITGQPGTRKAELARKLRDYALQERGFNPKAEGTKDVCDSQCRCYEVEAREWLNVDYLTFLSNYNESEQSRHWADSLRRILDDIKNREPTDCFLLIHTAFYRNGHFFSPLSWDLLLLFKPDCIITLIDDVYDVWQRIEAGPHDTHFSLDELLSWRSVEITIARSLALNIKLNPSIILSNKKDIPGRFMPFFGPPLPHFVMSVKHPLQTFYRLVFERDKRPLVYASFPITRTRQSEERIADINSFRESLQSAGAIVIDPLTIDELRMDGEDPRWFQLRSEDSFQEYQSTRWKLESPAIEPPNTYTSPFTRLSDEQIRKVQESIVQNVVDRDFRLVSQGRRLIAYRPFYPEKGEAKIGEPARASSDGVTREINYALGLSQAVWAFHPKCDWSKQQEDSFFSQLGTWSRITRFPTATQLKSKTSDDFSGFADLLQEVSALVKK